MPLPINTSSIKVLTRSAMQKMVKKRWRNESVSSITIGCLTGDLYDFINSVTLLVMIRKATQQKFEDDLNRLAELLKCMKPPINLIFPAGGTLLLPDGFQTLCTALGVAVTIVESEDQLFGVLRHLNERPDSMPASFGE